MKTMIKSLVASVFLAAASAIPASAAPVTPAGPATSAGTEAGITLVRACPRIYRPVCARRRFGPPRTYPNACVARNNRARILYRGRCRPTRACPRIYRPVCAIFRGRPRTFANRCLARNARARIIRPGPCRR